MVNIQRFFIGITKLTSVFCPPQGYFSSEFPSPRMEIPIVGYSIDERQEIPIQQGKQDHFWYSNGTCKPIAFNPKQRDLENKSSPSSFSNKTWKIAFLRPLEIP